LTPRSTPAERLVALAERVRRLTALNHDPEKYHVEKHEIETDLVAIARELAPGRLDERKAPDSKFTPGVLVRAGRHVPVERRGARRPGVRDASEELRRAFK
jgi:hypothetical protein